MSRRTVIVADPIHADGMARLAESHGFGESHSFKNRRIFLICKRLSGLGCLEPDNDHNVSGIEGIVFCPLIGMHLQNPSDTLLLRRTRIEHHGSLGTNP